MKEQNPALQDESIKTDNETCEMCATEKAEPESNTAQEETGCCCHCKTTARSQDERKKLMNRLSRIEGQIRGIKGMLEKDAYSIVSEILKPESFYEKAHEKIYAAIVDLIQPYSFLRCPGYPRGKRRSGG